MTADQPFALRPDRKNEIGFFFVGGDLHFQTFHEVSTIPSQQWLDRTRHCRRRPRHRHGRFPMHSQSLKVGPFVLCVCSCVVDQCRVKKKKKQSMTNSKLLKYKKKKKFKTQNLSAAKEAPLVPIFILVFFLSLLGGQLGSNTVCKDLAPVNLGACVRKRAAKSVESVLGQLVVALVQSCLVFCFCC